MKPLLLTDIVGQKLQKLPVVLLLHPPFIVFVLIEHIKHIKDCRFLSPGQIASEPHLYESQIQLKQDGIIGFRRPQSPVVNQHQFLPVDILIKSMPQGVRVRVDLTHL